MAKELTLCVPCAEKLKSAYELQKLGGGVNNKITCDECRRKRYGAAYRLLGRK